jgi:voltage-gated potassium channel
MRVPHIVVENGPQVLSQLRESCPVFLEGDVGDDNVLIEAGIESAKGLVSTIPSEADSVFLTLTARQLNPGVFIIARADSKATEKKLLRAGADRVIVPHEIGGRRMALTSLKPNLVDCLAVDYFGGELGLAIEEIEVRPGSAIAGKGLRESDLRSRHDVTVVAIKKPDGQVKVNPAPDTVIGEGDVLILVGESKAVEALDIRPAE